MRLSDKKFIIKLDDYYYCGKDESMQTGKGLGMGALGSSSSVPVFDKNKSNALSINDTLSLRTRIVEIIDAIRYQDIFKDKNIDKLIIEFVKEE